MLAVADTRVADDIERDDGILVLALHHAQDGELVDAALHGQDVLARLENEVGDERVADGFAVDGEVHGDVAEVECHDRGVGDVDCTDEVGAVGEDFVFAGEDLHVGDVEAIELVETCSLVSVVLHE